MKSKLLSLLLLALVVHITSAVYPYHFKGYGALNWPECEGAQICSSAEFTAQARFVRLELAEDKFSIYGPFVPGQLYHLSLPGESLLTVKPRISFLDRADNPLSQYLTPAIILFSLIFAIFLLSSRSPSPYWIFLILGLLLQYRYDLYFYLDEWTALRLFEREGLGTFGGTGVLSYRHNEHYLPLFFLFYMLESKLFGFHYSCYLLLTLALHALNAFLVQLIVLKFFDKLDSRFILANIIAFLFLVSALHAETLNWAFEQSILICSCFTLSAVIFAIDYLREGRKRDLLISLAFAGLTPFFFGNGFSSLGVLGLVCLVFFSFKRAIKLLFPLALWFGFCLLFYFSKQSVAKASANAFSSSLGIFDSLLGIGDYLFTATQLGVVLRGLGALSSLEVNQLNYLYLGVAISFVALLLTYFYQRKQFSLCLFGFALPFVCMILPAVERWQAGAMQGLSLRYSYLAVFGLFLMCAPLLQVVIEKQKVRAIFFIFLAAHIFQQLNLAHKYRFFSDYGLRHRIYVEELIDWQCGLKRRGIDNFEATGTELAGLQPTFPKTISFTAPGPMSILTGVDWLDRNACN